MGVQTNCAGFEVHAQAIKIDHYGLTEFIWLDDPDGNRIEYYLRQE
jgi:glyoxylase I family protein